MAESPFWRPLAVLPRALTWDLALATASDEERAATADFVVKLYRELIELYAAV